MNKNEANKLVALIPATCEGGNECPPGQDYCEEHGCQACCPHDEFDHYICLDCGYEKDPGDDIDAAEYAFGDD